MRKNVAVILEDTAKLDGVLAQALEAGVNHVHNIEPRTTELRKRRDRVRSMAIRAAHEKAVALADQESGPSDGAGSALGQIAGSATVSVVFDLE